MGWFCSHVTVETLKLNAYFREKASHRQDPKYTIEINVVPLFLPTSIHCTNFEHIQDFLVVFLLLISNKYFE